MAPEERRSNRYVESFARGLSVIRAFGADAPEMPLARIAERTGLTRANVRRVLLTLVELGYVEQEGRLFRLRPKILDLGFAYLSSAGITRFAQPMMEHVASRLQEPCNLSVLEGDDVIIIGRVAVRKEFDTGLGLAIGRRFPAHLTPMGRLLLAGLPTYELERYLTRTPLRRMTPRTVTDAARLRKIMLADLARGWSLVDQEHGDFICSMAVPIMRRDGRCVAALSVGWSHGDYTRQEVEQRLLPVLRDAAGEIGRVAGLGVTVLNEPPATGRPA